MDDTEEILAWLGILESRTTTIQQRISELEEKIDKILDGDADGS